MINHLGTGFYLEIDLITDPATNDRGTDANYILVACLTSNGFSVSRAAQSVTNKCTGGWDDSLSGNGTWSIPVEGQVVSLDETEEATMANSKVLKDLAIAGTPFFARTTDAAQTAAGYNEGKVRIGEFSETAPNDAPFTFTTTLTGKGAPFTSPATT
jgi:predicted secreted protein